METIEIGLMTTTFLLGWLVKGMAWVAVDTYLFGNQYCDPMKTLMNILLWPIGGLIRLWSYIERWLNR
jgi:hypothetical protein